MIAMVAELHPWLLDFSVEARGYSLVLLLGIIATNLLPTGLAASAASELAAEAASPVIPYALVMALAIYTVPLAVLLIPAHAVAMIILRRSAILSWLKGVCIELLLSTLLYLPMYRGLLSYYRNPYSPTIVYREFLDALPRYAMAGASVPHSPAIFWALPVITIIIGSVLGWSRASLRPMLITLGHRDAAGNAGSADQFRRDGSSVCSVDIAVVLRFNGERVSVRSAAMGKNRWRSGSFDADGLAGFCRMSRCCRSSRFARGFIWPIRLLRRGATSWCCIWVPANRSLCTATPRTGLLPAPDMNSMILMEKKAIADTGHLPWVVIFYEKLARDRNFGPAETRGLWTNLVTLYDAGAMLPGRLTPVSIFRPKAKIEDGR